MKIIKEREFHESYVYYRMFTYSGEQGRGFMFPSDEHGNVEPDNDAAAHNLAKCLDGTYDVIDNGVERFENSWWEPAVGECDCGREVHLDGFTNTCDCGADYNSSGQRLAPRSQWGEETGESLADILGPVGFDVWEER